MRVYDMHVLWGIGVAEQTPAIMANVLGVLWYALAAWAGLVVGLAALVLAWLAYRGVRRRKIEVWRLRVEIDDLLRWKGELRPLAGRVGKIEGSLRDVEQKVAMMGDRSERKGDGLDRQQAFGFQEPTVLSTAWTRAEAEREGRADEAEPVRSGSHALIRDYNNALQQAARKDDFEKRYGARRIGVVDQSGRVQDPTKRPRFGLDPQGDYLLLEWQGGTYVVPRPGVRYNSIKLFSNAVGSVFDYDGLNGNSEHEVAVLEEPALFRAEGPSLWVPELKGRILLRAR